MAIKQSELVAWIRSELSDSEGYDSDELAQLRKQALDRYYGRPRGDEKVGRSHAQSNDIADTIEAITATLIPAWQGDTPVEFEPDDDEDMSQAQMESDLVNDVVVEQNHGFCLFQEGVRDALLLRNAWVKVWLDERDEVTSERFSNVDPEAIAQSIIAGHQQGLEIEPVRMTENDDDTISVTLKTTQQIQNLKVVSIDPTLMRWQRDWDSIFIPGIRFLAERWFPTRSDLIQMGYPKAKVNAAAQITLDTETDSRARFRSFEQGQEVPDKSMQRLEAYWIYYRYDGDGDGVAEQHRILYLVNGEHSDGSILEDEIVSFVPYATGTAILQPHQLNGLGVYDKLKSVEDVKTDALRQWLDNLRVNNNGKAAVNFRKVVMDDATQSRPGGIIRIDGEVGGNYQPIPVNDVGASAEAALNYQDKVRSERAGASLDLMSGPAQMAGMQTATGVERVFGVKEMMAAMMCRTLSETLMREMYLLTHRALREWVTKPLSARIRGEFVEQNPSEWKERDRVNVKTGLSLAERQTKRSSMEAIVAQQEKLMGQGRGDLVTSDQYFASLMDWTRAAMVDNGDRYFLDPKSERSQQIAQQQAEQAQAQQEQQQAVQFNAVTAEQQRQQIENMLDKYKTDMELAFKYWQEMVKAEVAQANEAGIDRVQSIGEVRSSESQRAGIDTAERGSATGAGS
ncbi:MAG: hypothetical protein ACC642_00040 [Pseudomonadales bacterium]